MSQYVDYSKEIDKCLEELCILNDYFAKNQNIGDFHKYIETIGELEDKLYLLNAEDVMDAQEDIQKLSKMDLKNRFMVPSGDKYINGTIESLSRNISVIISKFKSSVRV
jgi:hypothetical protein